MTAALDLNNLVPPDAIEAEVGGHRTCARCERPAPAVTETNTRCLCPCHVKPHEQRVLDERRELADKLAKLTAFRLTPAFAALSLVDQGLLVKQAAHMEDYCGVLDARIKRFGAA